jgi:demethylmenaquinone methyltransferase / 2-methoxy-6-polyprenyl-1,4-benzoquinol methylase
MTALTTIIGMIPLTLQQPSDIGPQLQKLRPHPHRRHVHRHPPHPAGRPGLLHALRRRPPLDLCCGTGDVAFQLARSGAHTIGVDFSMPMLDIARRRQMRSPTTTWLVAADGQRLPFPNATFEVLTISYGLRNLPDFESGLREMARVTKPDGRLVVLDFALPSARPWRAVYLAYLHAVVPALGWLFCGNAAAYAYILESLRNYPNPAGITALLNHTGWTSVQSTPLLGGVMSLHHARRQTKPRDQIERTQV